MGLGPMQRRDLLVHIEALAQEVPERLAAVGSAWESSGHANNGNLGFGLVRGLGPRIRRLSLQCRTMCLCPAQARLLQRRIDQ